MHLQRLTSFLHPAAEVIESENSVQMESSLILKMPATLIFLENHSPFLYKLWYGRMLQLGHPMFFDLAQARHLEIGELI
jgi:hypothetical protein